jgi:peptidyl-prolyl cis-trans isomerase C
MTRNSASPRPQVLPLTLSCLLLLVAGAGCSRASESSTAKQGDKPAAAAPAAPCTPATPAPGAKPAAGAPGTAPGAPGAPAAEAPANPDKFPAVVARINGTDIKKEDLVKEAKGIQARMAQEGGPGAAANAAPAGLYHQVLDGMIARKLLETDAKAQGITVTDDDIKKQLEQAKSQFPTPEAFAKALATEGLTEQQLKDNFKRQMTIQKYVQAKILDSVKVTDEATKAFYDQNKDKMKQPERLHLRHILIKVEKDAPAADKQKAHTKADGLLARVKKGEDFAKLATENSDDPGSKAQGGDLSWVSRGDTVEPFEKAAFALKDKNEISPVVESTFGFHIIQLLERQPEGLVPYEQVKDRIGEMLKQRQAQTEVQNKIQALRAKADVKTFI